MNESPRLQQLLSLQADSPNDAFLIFALAKEHEKLGNRDMAFEHYLRLVEGSPDYVGTYYHLGKLYVQIGNIEAAISVYKAGMEVAKQANDRHAFSELAGAKLEISDED